MAKTLHQVKKRESVTHKTFEEYGEFHLLKGPAIKYPQYIVHIMVWSVSLQSLNFHNIIMYQSTTPLIGDFLKQE